VGTDGSCAITAVTQWGALRALETFAQLVWWNRMDPTNYVIWNASVHIVDAPRLQHRGLLLDTARHFQPVSSVLKVLDGMQALKSNVLHLHFVDDQSWSVQSMTYPQFTVAGAYAPWMIYSPSDMETIVQYATARGIQVLPEFDMPAHATAWGAAYPNLTIACPLPGQTLLNPTGPVYTVFDGLLREFGPVFNTSSFVHLGGDEVENFDCWQNSPVVQAWMAKMGFTTMYQVRNYFEVQVQQIAQTHGLSSIVWEEVFDGNYTLLPSTIVNIWLGSSETVKAINAGHRVIISYAYYLDQQDPAGMTDHYFWLDTALNFFQSDPAAGLTAAQANSILGGEASQWGEQIWPLSVFSRVFPRSSGSFYRFWSPASYTDSSTFLFNATVWSCRLQQRGFITSPFRPATENVLCSVPDSTFESMLPLDDDRAKFW
jgi:hexosaminidase